MNLIRRFLARSFWADTEATVSTEHALLLGLIAMAIIAAVTLLGQNVAANLYQYSVSQLPF